MTNSITETEIQIKEEIKIMSHDGGMGEGDPAVEAGVGEEKWNRAIRGILYALVFLFPILFTPWTFEPLEFPKQILLFVLTSGALGLWLLKLLIFRSWQFVKTPLDLPIGIFVIVYLLASLFSVDRIASFLGFYGSFSGNFFQVLFLVLFFYLVINNFQTIRQIKKLVAVFFVSVSLALLYAALQLLGLHIIPISLAQVKNFNTVGGLVAISVFSAFGIVMGLSIKNGKWFSVGGNLWKIIAAAAGLVILIAVNFLYAWIALLLGILVFMIFRLSFSEKQTGVRNVIVPLVLLILVAAFLVIQLIFPFLSVRNLFSFNIPAEVRLDYSTAMPVIREVIREQPVFGSGPNTFLYAFSQHRDENFNLSPFWNVRFDKAPSEAAEILVGTGVIGFLAFEILMLIFLIYAFLYLARNRNNQGWKMSAGLFSAFVALWFSHWFFFFSTIMAFCTWFVLAAFLATARAASGERTRVYSFSLSNHPRQTVSLVTAVSFLLVLVVIFLFFAFSVYVADAFYRQGLLKSNDVETYDDAQRNFEQAVQLNRFRPDYFLTYGEFLFLRINQELAAENPDLAQIRQWLAAGIDTSRAAVDLSPNNWTAWERLANLYTSARPLVAGVDRFIVESLERATQNDPKNPILFVELGQVHRLSARQIDLKILGEGVDTDSDGLSDSQERAFGSDPNNPDTNGNTITDGNEVLAGLDPAGTGRLSDEILGQYIRIDQESLLKAEEAFRKAIELKEDYAAAYFQLAATLEQSGRIDAAILELEKSLGLFPNNVTLKFELGRLYFNTGQVDKAARQFQEILALVPNHANARYSLGLAFERLGNPQRALIELRRVAEDNPDNVVLRQKIEELERQIGD